jgi:hypothetical protein
VAIVSLDPLSLYCDASGNEREPLTVVGGVLATVEEWLSFAPRWKRVLDKYGVRYFRASEFAQSRGAFAKGWKGNVDRRNAFSWDLLQELKFTLKWWVAVAIVQSEYDKADRIYEVHENFPPFAMAGETCIELTRKWCENAHQDYLPLKYFFESGDSHWGQMSDRIRERFGAPPIPGDKQEPPFQAADFVAYEIRKAFMDLEVKSGEIFQAFRKSFLLMGQIPGIWGNVTEIAIRTEMNQRGIRKRQ